MTKTVLIGNYKGGVGKTTSTLNLAGAFAGKGKKVLVIDLDPQGSLSELLVKRGREDSLDKMGDDETLNYVLDFALLKLEKRNAGCELAPGSRLIKQVFAPSQRYFDYIPSSPFYREGRMGLDTLVERMKDDVEYLSILKNYLDSVKENYDYILIDTPPSSTLLTKSAILLSDYYVIPTILEGLSTNGITHYIATVADTYRKYCVEKDDAIIARHIFGNEPKLIGIFGNLLRPTVNHQDEWQKLEDALARIGINKDVLLKADVNQYVDTARNTAGGYLTLSNDGFGAVADELFDRLEHA